MPIFVYKIDMGVGVQQVDIFICVCAAYEKLFHSTKLVLASFPFPIIMFSLNVKQMKNGRKETISAAKHDLL